MRKIKDGIIKENPIFVLILGMCSSLAVTTTFEKSYMMGLCVLFVLLFSNLIVSLIKKLIPESVKVPVFILIIGTFVTILGLLLERYVPSLYNSLGIYLSLITVNCIILGRAISVASKESVGSSLIDAIGIGLGYTLALMLIGLIREFIGNNSITIINEMSNLFGFKLILTDILPKSAIFPNNTFILPAGAFLTIGLLLGLFNYIRGKHESN